LDEPNAAGLAEALESVLQENQSHQLK
jgi:hypothetical protein